MPRSCHGFSLIELALVLGISGLMVGFVLQSQQSVNSADCYASTKLQLQDIDGAIQRFARTNDRLPLPASRNVGVEAPTYGREASGAAIDIVGTASWGALPFQALGLAPSYASDCWGNKFTYVVTTALTSNASSGGFLDYTVAGSITLKKDASNSLNSNTAYAVISHGQDALGAVKANYSAASHGWCSGTTLKDINCNKASAAVVDAGFNNGKDAGANYFDDLIISSGRQLNIVNGVCNNTLPLGCAAGSASSDNGATACGTTRSWRCSGANGGSNSPTCSYANAACVGCSASTLTWGGGCSATFPATAHNATTPATANNNPSFTTSSTATASCNNGSFSAPAGSCTAVPPPVNGVCNNSVALGCSAGSATSDNGQTACGTTRTWICSGSNGGSNSGSCSITNAACANCASTTRGWGAGCNAVFPATAHGASTPAQTNTNPAYTGSATAGCNNGSFSTPTGSCTAVVPVNGACDTSAPGGACAAGTPTSDNGQTACGTTRSWSCNGSNGGSNASCSRANDPCPLCYYSAVGIILPTDPPVASLPDCPATLPPACPGNISARNICRTPNPYAFLCGVGGIGGGAFGLGGGSGPACPPYVALECFCFLP